METTRLGVVDGAGPGVGGGGDGGGGVAGNVTGNARVGLDLGAGVGRHLDCHEIQRMSRAASRKNAYVARWRKEAAHCRY